MLLATAVLLWQESRAVGSSETLTFAPLLQRFTVPALLAGLGLLANSRWVWWALTVVAAALSFMLVGDRAFLEYFRQPLSAEMTVAVRQLADVGESTGSLVEPLDWLALAAVTLSFLVAAGRRVPGPARVLGLALVLAASLPTRSALSWAPAPNAVTGHGPVTAQASRFGLTLFHLADVSESLSRRWWAAPLPNSTRQDVLALFARRHELNTQSSPLFGIAAGRNVVHVQLEAFQHFLLGWSGPEGEVTPTLNRLADGGLSFERMMDTTRMGRTSSAEFQVLTGMPSHGRELVAFTHMGKEYVTLPGLLAERGYSTWSMHAYKRSFWNRAVTHPTFGIQKMLFADAWKPGPQVGWGLGDSEFLTQCVDALAKAEAPCFAHLVTLSCHHPFHAVPEHAAQWKTGVPADVAPMLTGYLQLAHYTDTAVEAFMRGMQERGLAENTLFVFYGDHDAGLDEASRRAVEDAGGPDLDHPREDRVPCVIVVPGQEQALRAHGAAFMNQFAGLHDIPATVLHLLGITPPPGILGTHAFVPDGARDVLPLPLGDSVVSRGRLLSGWDPPTRSAQERAERESARAQADVIDTLSDLALDHALQAVAARLPDEQLAQLAQRSTSVEGALGGTLAAAPDATPDTTGTQRGETPLSNGAWRRTPSGPVSPLPRRLIDALPRSQETLFEVLLVLRNESDQEQPWGYEALDGEGQALNPQHGLIASGQLLEVQLAPKAGEAPGTLGFLDAAPEVVADVRIRRAKGVVWRVPHSRTHAAIQISGSARGLDQLALVLCNPGPSSRQVAVTVSQEGQADQSWSQRMAPWAKSLRLLDVSQSSGGLSVTVEGTGVTADLLAWDDAGTTLR